MNQEGESIGIVTRILLKLVFFLYTYTRARPICRTNKKENERQKFDFGGQDVDFGGQEGGLRSSQGVFQAGTVLPLKSLERPAECGGPVKQSLRPRLWSM